MSENNPSGGAGRYSWRQRNRLARLRKGRGLDLEEVARLSGVSAGLLAAYEAGTRVPTAYELKALRDVLGCTADELLGATPPGWARARG
jgi:transcriptional regulator with XRE-family HTH domain